MSRSTCDTGQRIALVSWLIMAICGLAAIPVAAQSNTTNGSVKPLIEFPSLGPMPGAVEPSLGMPPGALEPGMEGAGPGLTGGRRRSGRIPKASRSNNSVMATRSGGMQLPEQIPAPRANRTRLQPTIIIEKDVAYSAGPPDGITLDHAIETVLRNNLNVRALRQEIPQADAEILTAGLRANPFIYVDGQSIPYGSYTDATPGGPTQYNINLTYPVDVSNKRNNRIAVARLSRTTLEAQYQDVVRRQVDNVYEAFVVLQAARVDIAVARRSTDRQETLVSIAKSRLNAKEAERVDDFFTYQLEATQVALGDAIEAYADAQENMALMMNLPAHQADGIHPKDPVQRGISRPLALDELTKIAIRCRPDLAAARHGISRANAEVALQRAARFDDVYLFYDPIQIQDNRPLNAPNAKAWAVGVTFALPLYNRNQGNIARAQANVGQTRLELEAMERTVVTEVRMAEREYHAAYAALTRIEEQLLPRAQARLEQHLDEFNRDDIAIDELEEHFQEAAELAQTHREAVFRLRRSELGINTAIGLRLLP